MRDGEFDINAETIDFTSVSGSGLSAPLPDSSQIIDPTGIRNRILENVLHKIEHDEKLEEIANLDESELIW
jgi:hypothetical protein